MEVFGTNCTLDRDHSVTMRTSCAHSGLWLEVSEIVLGSPTERGSVFLEVSKIERLHAALGQWLEQSKDTPA